MVRTPAQKQKWCLDEMQVLNFIRLFWGVGFPFHKNYLQFRYLKCLLISPTPPYLRDSQFRDRERSSRSRS